MREGKSSPGAKKLRWPYNCAADPVRCYPPVHDVLNLVCCEIVPPPSPFLEWSSSKCLGTRHSGAPWINLTTPTLCVTMSSYGSRPWHTAA